MSSSRRITTSALAAALAASGVGLAATTATAATPAATTAACATGWGSLDKVNAGTGFARVSNVRSGRHACFDRLVIDLASVGSGTIGYRIGYRSSFTDIAKGDTIPLRGNADLVVSVHAPAYDAQGRATWTPANRKEVVNVTGYSTFRQVAYGGSFEGETLIGIGTRARLPMRAVVLKSGTTQRLVIDVAHSW